MICNCRLWLAVMLIATIPSKSLALRVGYFNLAPHSTYIQNGSQEGIAIKYFREVSKEMGLKDVSFVEYPLPRLLTLLETNQIDMALFLAKSRQRDKLFTYPKQPFFEMQSVIVVKSGSKYTEFKSVEDLISLKIGVWQGGYLSPMILDKRLKLESLTGGNVIERNLRKVVAGRIDAYYSPDKFSVVIEAKRFGLLDKVKILNFSDNKLGLYSVFSKKSAKKFKNNYEKALSSIQAKYSYEQFLLESMK